MTVSTVDSQASIINRSTEQRVDWDGKRTPWKSIWIGAYMQFVVGIQMSIYYMSTWPYLSDLDSTADFHFVGWVIAASSIGCSIANPIFGWWNQKTMSVTTPTIFGFLVSCFGQALYALLPVCPSHQKWIMVLSRLIIGFGTGSIAVLRAYTATAAVPKDKLTAISYTTAAWVLGLSLGPALQSAFSPMNEGFVFLGYKCDLYTTPPYFMIVVNLLSCAVMWISFKETYSGILDQEEQDAANVTIPKFDLPAALVCVWLWICSCSISTNIEVMSTPLSTVMFQWNDSKSILWNGVLTSVTSFISVLVNFLIGSTRIGKIDRRKQILFGLALFMAYHVCNYPWFFYDGPLSYLPEGTTSTTEVGGCLPSYKWCSTTVAIPLPVYILTFVLFFGIGFPFIGSTSASLFTEILGPRPQGNLQGMYSFGGSMAQFVAPVFATFLFQHTGYQWVMVTQMMTLGFGILLMLVFYRRLVPLELKAADNDKAAITDSGSFSSI